MPVKGDEEGEAVLAISGQRVTHALLSREDPAASEEQVDVRYGSVEGDIDTLLRDNAPSIIVVVVPHAAREVDADLRLILYERERKSERVVGEMHYAYAGVRREPQRAKCKAAITSAGITFTQANAFRAEDRERIRAREVEFESG